jgi:hypothetical protein
METYSHIVFSVWLLLMWVLVLAVPMVLVSGLNRPVYRAILNHSSKGIADRWTYLVWGVSLYFLTAYEPIRDAHLWLSDFCPVSFPG